jgi:hypothetical protein
MSSGLRSPMKFSAASTNVATTSPGSTETALPVGDSGNRTRFYYVALKQVVANSRTSIKPTADASGDKVGTGGMILSHFCPLILDCSGMTHLSHVSTAAGNNLCITPLENG